MKQFLLLFVGCLLSSSIYAQMPDGSMAPDFNSTDLNGNSVSLYSDFLDQGIPVIMDVSATWCPPCWSFHEGHALKNIYMNYGPAGSNEIGVLFVEGDGSTGLAELNGTGNTQGDWVTGTPYPILDDANIASLYQIGYYPTMYGICPNRTVYEIGTGSVSALLSALQQNCGVGSFSGSQDNIGVDEGSTQVCISGGNADVTATVHNYGSNMVMNMTAELFEVGNPTAIQSLPWSGVLPPNQTTNVQFAALTNITAAANYQVTVSNPNGNVDNFPTYNTSAYDVSISDFTTSSSVDVIITLDNWPQETTWRLIDGSGTILANAGPYQGNGGSGGPDAGQTYTYPVNIPSGTDCYELIVDDTYGDGMSVAPSGATAGYRVNDGSVDVIASDANPAFGNSVTESFGASASSSSSIDDILVDGIFVYPNPSTNFTNVNFNLINSSKVSVKILNVLGQNMFSENYNMSAGLQNVKIDVENLINGVYFLEVNINGEVTSQKITVTK